MKPADVIVVGFVGWIGMALVWPVTAGQFLMWLCIYVAGFWLVMRVKEAVRRWYERKLLRDYFDDPEGEFPNRSFHAREDDARRWF